MKPNTIIAVVAAFATLAYAAPVANSDADSAAVYPPRLYKKDADADADTAAGYPVKAYKREEEFDADTAASYPIKAYKRESEYANTAAGYPGRA